MTGLPILYSFRRCPYAMRARMALFNSGVCVELREVVLRNKPDEMLAASPKGTVPVLVLPDGRVIDESIDIMRWALTRHDPDHWLSGDDGALIAANDGPFKRALDRYKYPDRYGSDPLEHRALGMDCITALDARLASTPWLCGDQMTLADIAIMPFVRQFAATDRAWFEAQPVPHVQRWLDRLCRSDLFAAAMVRVPAWQTGQEPVLFGASECPKA